MAIYSSSSQQDNPVRKELPQNFNDIDPTDSAPTQNYRFLHRHQIEMIDEALSSVGDFGEVRLVVERGRLRFLVTQKSFDTMKWHPGSLKNESE